MRNFILFSGKMARTSDCHPFYILGPRCIPRTFQIRVFQPWNLVPSRVCKALAEKATEENFGVISRVLSIKSTKTKTVLSRKQKYHDKSNEKIMLVQISRWYMKIYEKSDWYAKKRRSHNGRTQNHLQTPQVSWTSTEHTYAILYTLQNFRGN